MEAFQFIAGSRPAPTLVGGLGQGGDMDALAKRFGDRWTKTPAKECWCLAIPGMQFTIIPYREKWDIAFYEYETVAEFRKAFTERTHVGNAIYFQTLPSDKYTGLAVVRFLKERGLWE